jgi:hypothetical protein
MSISEGTKDTGWRKVSTEPTKPQPTAPPIEQTTATPGANPGERTPVDVGNSRAHGGHR